MTETNGRATDNDERTTALGLYNFACSYHRAADALLNAPFRATHPDAPKQFLYFHAIELYLKAFLRSAGLSVQELRGLGHEMDTLKRAFVNHGGSLPAEMRHALRADSRIALIRVKLVTERL